MNGTKSDDSDNSEKESNGNDDRTIISGIIEKVKLEARAGRGGTNVINVEKEHFLDTFIEAEATDEGCGDN